MPIDVLDITDEQLRDLCSEREGHYLDFKDKRLAPSKLGKHISAFANAEGGDLYIGISERKIDNGKEFYESGFSDPEDANGLIAYLNKQFPISKDFDYSFLLTNSNNFILKIEVHKNQNIIEDHDGTVYIRLSAQSVPVNTEAAMERLRYNKGLTSFETTPINCKIDIVTNSETIIKFALEIVPSMEPEVFLNKQMLIYEGKPIAASVILYADLPQSLLPKRCAIKLYKYETGGEGTRQTLSFDPITIEGCAYDQIYEAVSKTIEIIENIPIIEGEKLRKIQYPKEAIYEIITNAIIHRDYSIPDDVHIRIYDNRIEIESPGKLPGHITVDNILSERYARNGAIVRLINKFPNPPNKDVGEGMNTAFESMRNLRLKVPQIIEKENAVIVNIRHESLARPEEQVIEYLKIHGEINNSKGREICYIGSENVMKRVFEKLIAENLVERVPDKRGKASAYRLLTLRATS